MKKIKFILLIVLSFTFFGCFDDMDDNPASIKDINDFVYKGMNNFYLYKYDVASLETDLSLTSNYDNYLNSYSSPELLFESLIYQRETTDRFSWIVSDYIALEQQLSGVSKSNGLEFNFYYEPGSSNQVFGVIRLVLNNSEASNAGLQRGQIIHAINGQELTINNYNSLASQESYTLNFASYNDNGTENLDDDFITPNNQNTTLTKIPYTENPIYLTKTLNIEGETIGYLMYNAFTADFNQQLNNAVSELKANNIQHLVLDLRYNPGGSVNTATLLGSMVTGQFNGSTFTKLNYNEDLSNYNTTYNFTNNYEGMLINNLNLNKVYVLTSQRSASASEMVINSLKSYIDVVQIGGTTTGKSQASITLYDAPDFLTRSEANPSHRYAMQPLVAITVNVNDTQVPPNGLTPNIEAIETPNNYGILGNVNEPLLAIAIADILGTGKIAPKTTRMKPISNTINQKSLKNNMYIDLDKLEFSLFNN